MTEEDLKLFKKFEQLMDSKPTEDQALDLWSNLSAEEYDRLICLFEQNKPEGMDDKIRLELIEIFKKLKAKLLELKSV